MDEHRFKVIILILLVIQNSSLSFFMSYSKIIAKEHYSQTAIILCSELLKLVISFTMILVNFKSKNHQSFMSYLIFLIKNSLLSSVPAVMYFIQNLLYGVALSNIEPGLFSILQQVKTLVGALLSVLLLKRILTFTQWRAIFSLILSLIIVEQSTRPDTSHDVDDQMKQEGNYFLGVVCAILVASTSGFNGVIMEIILKNVTSQTHTFDLWERNLQLALYSIAFCFIKLLTTENELVINGTLFEGFSFYAICFIIDNSLGGILVAMVLKYCDSIIKGLALSIAIIINSLLSYFFFNGVLGLQYFIGALCVIISVQNFNDTKASYQYQSSLDSNEIHDKENNKAIKSD